MNMLQFDLTIGAVSVADGLLGALTGLGGRVVIVPVLALLFGVVIFVLGVEMIYNGFTARI